MRKTTKNKKTKIGLLSKINFRSTKTRMIVTVLTFAIIGGGYMVYKSFAATPSIYFTAANGGLTTGKGSSVTTETRGSKKNTSVMKLLPGNDNYITVRRTDASNAQVISFGQNFRLCIYETGQPVPVSGAQAYVRANVAGVISYLSRDVMFNMGDPNNYNGYTSGEITNVDGVYAKVCSGWKKADIDLYKPIYIYIKNRASNIVYISTVSIDTQ